MYVQTALLCLLPLNRDIMSVNPPIYNKTIKKLFSVFCKIFTSIQNLPWCLLSHIMVSHTCWSLGWQDALTALSKQSAPPSLRKLIVGWRGGGRRQEGRDGCRERGIWLWKSDLISLWWLCCSQVNTCSARAPNTSSDGWLMRCCVCVCFELCLQGICHWCCAHVWHIGHQSIQA